MIMSDGPAANADGEEARREDGRVPVRARAHAAVEERRDGVDADGPHDRDEDERDVLLPLGLLAAELREEEVGRDVRS